MKSTKSAAATTSEAARKWGLRVHVLCYVVANVIQVMVWWFFTPDQHFWPVWSIVSWGIGLAFHIWGSTRRPGSAPGTERVRATTPTNLAG